MDYLLNFIFVSLQFASAKFVSVCLLFFVVIYRLICEFLCVPMVFRLVCEIVISYFWCGALLNVFIWAFFFGGDIWLFCIEVSFVFVPVVMVECLQILSELLTSYLRSSSVGWVFVFPFNFYVKALIVNLMSDAICSKLLCWEYFCSSFSLTGWLRWILW